MSRVSLTFLWETPARAIPVFSVFIPFFGCPRRCVFCSQHDQTGQQASPLDEILARAAADLHARRAQGRPPVELAFYGGTFTALAPRDLDACLDMADSLRRDGCITRFRCSTRPDRLDAALLARLRRHGCRTVDFPSISTGVYGYPLPQAAHVALKAMTDFLRDHPGMHLRMICHNPNALRAYQVDWNMFYQDVKPHA